LRQHGHAGEANQFSSGEMLTLKGTDVDNE